MYVFDSHVYLNTAHLNLRCIIYLKQHIRKGASIQIVQTIN